MAVLKDCHQTSPKVLLKWWLSLKIVIKHRPKFYWSDGCLYRLSSNIAQSSTEVILSLDLVDAWFPNTIEAQTVQQTIVPDRNILTSFQKSDAVVPVRNQRWRRAQHHPVAPSQLLLLQGQGYEMSNGLNILHPPAKGRGWNGHRFLCVPHRSWGFNVCNKIKYQCPGVTVPKCRRYEGVL